MTERKVTVERYIEQVCDGSKYKGTLKIADTTFDYELMFATPIPKLVEPLREVEEIRRVFQIVVKRNGAEIEIANNEYRFFFDMLVKFALKFYNDPQVRESNDGLGFPRGPGPVAAVGLFGSIGAHNSDSYPFPPELCEMLNSPKFGCALTV